MFRKKSWLPGLLLLFWGWAALAQAQSSTPLPAATATPQPTAAPTEPPAILIIEPTPVPDPGLQGNLWQQLQQVWQQNTEAILLALILALVTGVLVGVVFKGLVGKLGEWGERLFHFLFDRFAAVPLIRLRYEKDYRAAVAASVQDLQGGNLVDKEIRLDKMYVPSLLTEETQPDVRGDLADRYRTRDEIRRQQRARSVDPWEAVRRYHRFVVLGGPGVGKTTYLYHLTFMCAQRRRPEVAGYIPIFIRFREMLCQLEKLERLEDGFPQVFAENNFPNAAPFIEQQLREGRCLVLLDGLDELPRKEDHLRMIDLVQGFANRHVPAQQGGERQNILVVSSRKYSYEHSSQLTGFEKTEVMEFDRPAIERFVHNWFAEEEGTDSDLADELLAELQGNKRFLELARNPLLLLLITNHYERERNLPDLRAELYRHCIRTRITRWNTIRGTHRGRFGENVKWRLLRELALYTFQQEKEGLLRQEVLLDWLDAFGENLRLPPDTTPQTLLEEVARTSGLIQEWAIGRYGFSHQTLQEFFAAEAADRRGAEDGAALLEEHLDNPAWKEVILLYAGLADNAQPLLQRIAARARQPENGKTMWLLAGQCLAEGAQQITEPLRREIATALVELLRQTEPAALTPEESEAAIAALQTFGGDLLPAVVADLLPSEADTDWLLAARLAPEDAPPELQEAIAARLARLSRTGDSGERQAAAAALGRLKGVDDAAIIALMGSLTDPDAAARAEAALALGRLGEAGKIVLDALLAVYENDPADEPRQAALEALLALRREEAVDMVYVPAGEFLMGSGEEDKAADDDEKPQHTLYLPAYFMDRTPVTNAQFRRFMAAGGYANEAYWPEAIAAGRWKEGKYIYSGEQYTEPRYWNDAKWNGDEQPVVGVSWYEALAYARWAGKRLPTEAEWEKAARGTDGRLYPWGSEWDETRANTKEAGLKQTTPVGQYSPQGDSPYGAADTVGNVWEWCSTRSGYAYPYTPDDGREDLSGGDDVGRVLRGGSWYDDKKWARCGARYWDTPRLRCLSRGFRCCATSSLSPGSES